MVGDGWDGPPKPSICSDHSRHTATSAARCFCGLLACMVCADLRATDAVAEDSLSGSSAHGPFQRAFPASAMPVEFEAMRRLESIGFGQPLFGPGARQEQRAER